MILQLPATFGKETARAIQTGAQEAAERTALHANEFTEIEVSTPYWDISPITLGIIILGIVAIGVAITWMSMKYDNDPQS